MLKMSKMCKLRVTECKGLAQVHSFCDWQISGSNTGLVQNSNFVRCCDSGLVSQLYFRLLTSACVCKPSLEILLGFCWFSLCKLLVCHSQPWGTGVQMKKHRVEN